MGKTASNCSWTSKNRWFISSSAIFSNKFAFHSPVAIAVFALVFVLLANDPAHAKYIQLDGVMDVKTQFSSGCVNVQETATQAEQAGLDVVVFNDRVRNSIQYGIPPFRRLIKKTIEGSSILSTSPGVYLSNINEMEKRFRETILIPGAEVSPFYFWTGSVFKKNLVAHNWDKRLSIIGLDTGKDFEQVPILDSNLSTRYAAKFQNTVIGFGLLLMIAIALIVKGYYRKVVIPVTVFIVFLIFNNHPFRSSLFDQYSGDPGVKPYQEVIDYAVSKGAMIFWDDLEASHGKREWGTIELETKPHPKDLLLSKNYTGFQAVADEPVPSVDPANVWDQVLMQYIRGERTHPVWGYGGNNFRCAGEGGPLLGAVRNIFLVREKKRDAVMDAMRKGRMYAVRQPGPHRLSLDKFHVKDVLTGKIATLGEQLVSTDFPEISFKVHSKDGKEKRARMYLIRNGKVIKRESVILPYELKMIDSQVDMSGPVYYRLNVISSPVDHLISNPVFVKFGKTASVASTVASREIDPPVFERPESPAPETPKAAAPETPIAPETKEVENPQLAKLEPPKPPAVQEIPQAPPAPVPAPVTVPEPSPPTRTETPAVPEVKSPAPVSNEKYVRALIDGVSLKQGPGAVFPEVGKALKGDRLLLVRKTKIVFNDKLWLVVKKGDQLVYVWEGLVKEE